MKKETIMNRAIKEYQKPTALVVNFEAEQLMAGSIAGGSVLGGETEDPFCTPKYMALEDEDEE